MKKQKSGLYRTAVTVAGEKIWLSARTKAELEEKKRETKQRMIYGVDDSDITFHELVHRWWHDVKEPAGLRPSTIANKRTLINKWILAHIDHRQHAGAVRRADLQNIINRMVDENCCRDWIVDCKKAMEQICMYGQELGCMRANFAHNLIIAAHDDHSQHRTGIPDNVIQDLFAHADDDLLLLSMLVYTGMRGGELVALTWADIDFDNAIIHVTKSYDQKGKEVSKTKTRNGVRDIIILPQLMRVLRAHRGTPAARVLGFCDINKYRHAWNKLMLRSGYATVNKYKTITPEYCPHQLRHTFATMLHRAGIDQVAASRMLGHSSYITTADIYTDISTNAIDASALQKTFAQVLHKDEKNA